MAVDGRGPVQSTAGWEKTGPNPTDRGKGGVKRSLLTDARGTVVGLAVDGAHRHDVKLLGRTLHSVPVRFSIRVKLRPDKGYDYSGMRRWPEGLGVTVHVRARGEEANALKDGHNARPRRWMVERNPGWLNRYRRL